MTPARKLPSTRRTAGGFIWTVRGWRLHVSLIRVPPAKAAPLESIADRARRLGVPEVPRESASPVTFGFAKPGQYDISPAPTAAKPEVKT
jgi:hypothetical protein